MKGCEVISKVGVCVLVLVALTHISCRTDENSKPGFRAWEEYRGGKAGWAGEINLYTREKEKKNGKIKPKRNREMMLDLGGRVKMKLMHIPAGDFKMGSNNEEANSNEQPFHLVKITKPFYMGVNEVTQEQYEIIMGKNPASSPKRKSPVECVSWDNAREFCRRLSRKTGKTIRLPTEAQWEYACRAGAATKYCFGDSKDKLGKYAWYDDNAEDAGKNFPQPVGRKKPNSWRLYDMHGNVWEWCLDWYDSSYYERSPRKDPKGPESGKFRVLRGASWYNSSNNCRSAFRGWYYPSHTYYGIGFRIVLLPEL